MVTQKVRNIFFPRLVMCKVNLWTPLQFMLYLGNVELFPDDFSFNFGMVFLDELWPASNRTNKFGGLGLLIFLVAIWASRRLARIYIPRVVMWEETFGKYLQLMIYLGNVEVDLVPSNCHYFLWNDAFERKCGHHPAIVVTGGTTPTWN